MVNLEVYLDIQHCRKPDNHYFDDAIISWDIVGNGLYGTAGIIQPGFVGEFDIPHGGEQVSLLEPEADEVIEFDVLNDSGITVNLMTLQKHGEIFVPAGRDRLTTPLGQSAVRYLCLYPGRPA